MVATEHADVILRDGGTLRLRPPTRGDADALLAFFSGLSQRSLYLRFHGFPQLGPRLVESLVEPDWHERGVLLGALVDEDGERVVAVANYVRLRDPKLAEAAFTVADEHQGRGIGTRLLEQLAQRAAEVGIERFVAYVLPDNRAMVGVFEAAGFALTRELESGELELIARRLRALIEARLVTIALPAGDGTLQVEAADGNGAGEIVGIQLERAGSKSGRVLERRRAERVDSLLDDPEVDQEAARRLGARSGLYVPLIAGGRPIGVIVAHDREGTDPRFSDADLRLAETFGPRAAVAVDLSARVAGDALRRVVEAQELERRRLARELHDQTGQELTSVLLGLKAVEEARSDGERAEALAAVREQVVETLHDVRRLAVELRPKALDDFGLVAALERLRDTFSEQTGMRVDLEAQIDGRLPSDIETALYRIVQEALTNIVKHAQAGSVSIVLTRSSRSVTAVIEDNGRGFTPDGGADGLGLLGMGERLALLGGKLKVESSPGAGATIVAEVPLQ